MQRRIFTAAAAFTLVLGLSACGDDSDDDDSSATTAASDDGGGGGGGEADITIQDFAFNPDSLTVTSGDTITVSNADGTTHTFTSDDGGFDVELDGGASDDVEITAEPGTYDFHCNIHTSMTGTLTVE